jgi:hypothetical protein
MAAAAEERREGVREAGWSWDLGGAFGLGQGSAVCGAWWLTVSEGGTWRRSGSEVVYYGRVNVGYGVDGCWEVERGSGELIGRVGG